MFDSDNVRELVVEAKENRDPRAADLASDKIIDKKGVISDNIETVLNKCGLKYRRKRIMQDFSD